MNKSELIEKTADLTGLAKTDIDNTLKTILGIVTEELTKGRKVTLVGFGTFERRNRKARTGVNPQDPSQKIRIPAKKAPAFSAGSELKDSVQSGKAPSLANLVKKKAAAKKKATAKKTAKKTVAKKKTAAKKKKKARR